MRNHFLYLIICWSALVLSACSSIHPKHTHDESHEPMSNGTPISATLAARIAQSRVVFVGESHTDYGHHLNQLAVIRKSAKMWGGVLSIGLEMVQQPYQRYLDDYIAGNINEQQMLRGVQWYSRWGYDFRLYRPIFQYARQHKIPLIALNIPRELSRRVAKVGIAGLNVTERRQLPALIDQSMQAYRARLRKVFALHSHRNTLDEAAFTRFVDAQLAWDEGMAFATSKYLKKYPNQRMVILAGSGHLKFRHGIPARLDRQLSSKSPSLVILSHNDVPYALPEADFSLLAPTTKLAPAGVIGIAMKDTEAGVTVTRVVAESAADKAGLEKGDVVLQLGNTRVKTSADVNLWRLDKKPGHKTVLRFRRNKQALQANLRLGMPAPAKMHLH